MELIVDHLTRQLDIIPVEALGQEITIIGAGAIGSFTALSLVKMGFENLHVWDFDNVSVENMNCQFYRFSDIGRNKAAALRELIHDFTKADIKATPAAWDGQELKGIVITAVDSMKVRQAAWERLKKSYSIKALIDPRMASEYALCYVMNPLDERDQKSYEKTLYSDEKAVQERCTAKATIYTATMIAGYVAKMVKDLMTTGKYARVTHWDIGMNHHQAWAPEGEER